MPLPAALLARLKKRGIVKPPQPEIEEEVIAEDYDDEEEKKDDHNNNNNAGLYELSDKGNDYPVDINEPVAGCPNKWNIYHECSSFCLEQWGNGKLQPSPKTDRKRVKMLKKYPLPEGWEEIYDPGTGRFYYWSTKSGEVSWLPPGHPRTQISLPASKLRTLLKDTIAVAMEEDHDPSPSEDEDSDEEEEPVAQEVEKKERHHSERYKSRGRVRENDLDPMDPAAYSEAPRGTWSSGLDRKGEAKTGADTTASGPLYQMRPYPSPGAVLRLNAELKHTNSDESDDDD